jgi:membrane fusion protein (multidrug efflux system)
MKKNRGFSPLAIVGLLSASLILAGCDNKETRQNSARIPEVGVITLKAQPFDIVSELPGRTSAFRIAEVRPQVSGIILKRNFTEGSDVKEGMSLYQIDPATYQATYNSAKADLAKAQSSAQLAHVTISRYKPLLGTNYVSKQDYDNASANAAQADASVMAAKATLDAARINLAYTKVTAPISGRIGKSSVTEGALVTNGQVNALATIQQLDPIYVDLTQSSNDFLRLKQQIAQGSVKPQNDKIEVKLILDNNSEYPQTGTLQFSDVTVDASTGSITLRALFPNPQKTLLPGMFVRAKINEGVNERALLLTQQGITRNARGDATALVVSTDNKVEMRNVTTTQSVGNKWLITAGLQDGDKVIISGLQKVKPGMQVTTQEMAPTPQTLPSTH